MTTHPSALPVAPGAELELTVDRLAYGGPGVGRVEGLVVLVEGALPGQRLRVRVIRRHRRHVEARVLAVLAESPHFTPPFCRHFGVCGGCRWQHLAYPEQVGWKGRHLEECLAHLGKVAPREFLPPVPSPRRIHYRNKMTFTFAPGPGKSGLRLGLHCWEDPGEVFDLEECHLLGPQTGALVREVRGFCRRLGLAAYEPRRRRGFWHSLMLREGKRTGQLMVHLLTAGREAPPAVEALAGYLQERFPELTTLTHAHLSDRSGGPRAPRLRTLSGPGHLEEELAGVRLRVSPDSFLQPNTEAAELLYEAIGRHGDLSGREVAWDLYCGAGGIALTVAPAAARVVGFELSSQAVADARVNARLNRRENCLFLAGDLAAALRQALADPSLPRPEVIIADPPRAGLHPAVVAALKELAPRRLLLVSCHPATLARDLALLKDAFEVLSAQAFDFFPHTPHLEALAVLARRGG